MHDDFNNEEHNSNNLDNIDSNNSGIKKRRSVYEVLNGRALRFTWVVLLFAILVFTMPLGWLANLVGYLNAQSLVRYVFSIGAIVLLVFYNKGAGFKFTKETIKNLHLFAIAIIVSVLNFPIFTLISGNAYFYADTGAGQIVSYVFWVFSVALFEELIFRGLILTLLFVAFKRKKLGPLFAILVSSGMFGIVHLLNAFSAASAFDVGIVFMQVGYTFLLGLLWGVLFYFTKSIWAVFLTHAVFNMGGFLLTSWHNRTGYVLFRGLGGGQFWNTPHIAVFAVACVLVAAFFAYWFSRHLMRLKDSGVDGGDGDGELEIRNEE